MDFLGANGANYSKGRQGNAITGIVIHSIVGTLDSCIRTFQDPNRKASANYGVGWDGRVVQFVLDADTAWHAGNWQVNLTTIGIEHDDQANPASIRPDVLYEASAHLVASLCQKYNIPCDRAHIKKHSEVSSKGTACPAALDIERIVAHARELLTPAIASSYTGVVTPGNGDVNIRNTPHLSGIIVTHYPQGQMLPLEAQTTGDSVLNNAVWYKLSGKDEYVWSGRIEIQAQPAPATPTVFTQPVPTPPVPPQPETPAVIADDHALIDIGGSYGTQELQAVRSMLRDKDQNLSVAVTQLATKTSLLDKIAHLFGLS